MALGWFLRESGARWTSIELLSCAVEYCRITESTGTKITEVDEAIIDGIQERQRALNAEIEACGLTDVHLVKSVLDGKAICALYEVKPGKILKSLLDELLTFQILQPQA